MNQLTDKKLTNKQQRILGKLPGTPHELSKVLPISSKTIGVVLESLEKLGLAHIADWPAPRNGGKRSPFYESGPGENAPHPTGRGLCEVTKEGRRFHILGDDTHHAIRMERAPIQRDPLVAALFGPALIAA